MEFSHVYSFYTRELIKNTLQIVGFTILLTSFYAAGLFILFLKEDQKNIEKELQYLTLYFQEKIQPLEEVASHLLWHLQQLPEQDALSLRRMLSEMRLAAPLNFPPLIAVTWVSEGRPEISIPLDAKAFVKTASPRTLSKSGWSHDDQILILKRTIKEREPKASGSKGSLLLEIPVKHVMDSPLFTFAGVNQENSSIHTYKISLPNTTDVFVLQLVKRSLFSLFLKMHSLALLFFVLVALSISTFFYVVGRKLYDKALAFLKDVIEVTQQTNVELEYALQRERNENACLMQQNTLMTETTQQRETLMREVLTRHRLMREKAYLAMIILAEESTHEEDEEGLGLLIENMRNHFGHPHVKTFNLKKAVEQVLAIFAPNMQENQIKVTFTASLQSDVIETDRLIFCIILANLMNRAFVSMPRGSSFYITLSRQRNIFKVQLQDNGYALHDANFIAQVSRHQFFFLEPDVLDNLCASIKAKVSAQEKATEGIGGLNNVLLNVPLRIKRMDSESSPSKAALPDNVVRFPKKKKKSKEWSDPAS